MKFKKEVNSNFIRKFALVDNNPHIILQHDDMINLLIDGDSPMQTDTVEGFLYEPRMKESQSPNLTITSTYDFTLNRWVPVCVSILFGKSTADYNNHWNHVLTSSNYDSLKDFEDRFPGNTSDFSDALRKSFFESVEHFVSTTFQKKIEKEKIASFYEFCQVHFLRSKSRVAKNRSVVTKEKLTLFNKSIDIILKYKSNQFDAFIIECQLFMKSFPNAKAWIKWYLHPDRAFILFPACSSQTVANKKKTIGFIKRHQCTRECWSTNTEYCFEKENWNW